ncbi:hypothetical protein V8E54_009710 [Elaphomyces granulatus]
MMALLLDRRDNRTQTTDDVVKAAANNGRCGKEVMSLLLNWIGEMIKSIVIISETVTMICAKFDSEIVKLLLDRQSDH